MVSDARELLQRDVGDCDVYGEEEGKGNQDVVILPVQPRKYQAVRRHDHDTETAQERKGSMQSSQQPGKGELKKR